MNRIGIYYKTLIAIIPVVIFGINAVVEGLGGAGLEPPAWLLALSAGLTAFLVYLVPNTFDPGSDHRVAHPWRLDHDEPHGTANGGGINLREQELLDEAYEDPEGHGR